MPNAKQRVGIMNNSVALMEYIQSRTREPKHNEHDLVGRALRTEMPELSHMFIQAITETLRDMQELYPDNAHEFYDRVIGNFITYCGLEVYSQSDVRQFLESLNDDD